MLKAWLRLVVAGHKICDFVTERTKERKTERSIDIRATVNTGKVVHTCLRWHTFDSGFGPRNDNMQVVRVRIHFTLMLHIVKVGKLLTCTQLVISQHRHILWRLYLEHAVVLCVKESSPGTVMVRWSTGVVMERTKDRTSEWPKDRKTERPNVRRKLYWLRHTLRISSQCDG